MRRTAPVLLTLALIAGCARAAAPPSPADPTGPIPDLRGQRVMLFPVQSLRGVGPALDAELAFALEGRGGGVDWVAPEEMSGASRTSPGMDVRLSGLPVGMFLQGEVRRVGDPLLGYLLRMGALVDAELAFLPVEARYRPAAGDVLSGVEIAAALVAVRSGQVLWFGVVEGAPGDADDPRSLASAAEALSRRVLPIGGGAQE